MNILFQVREILKAEIAAATLRTGMVTEQELPEVILETPKHKSHGDFASNIAMQLTRAAKKPPRQIAEEIVANFDKEKASIEKIEIAGPGFINFFMDNTYLQAIVPAVLDAGDKWGANNVGNGQKILVEYVSANPTGDLHVGHARGAAVGDSLCNILELSGYQVGREYYINDAGNQINNLALSVEARYRQALGQQAELPAEGYHGQDIQGFGQELAQEHGEALLAMSEQERLAFCRKYGLERELDKLRTDLKDFRVEFDKWFSETSLYEDKIPAALATLQAANLTYEQDGATWFKTTEFGDSKDRVLIKNDGSYTYMVPDIAYHRDKMQRGYDKLINIWGADHHGYIARMQAAMQALGYEAEQLEILILQMVNLFQDGEKVKMSKRTGKSVTLRDLMDDVGVDPTRYFLTILSSDSTLDFDMDLAVSRSNDNPVYYVKYAHARICSMLRNATDQGIEDNDKQDLTTLNSEREFDLLKKVGEFPDIVAEAAERRTPHTVTHYGFELASQLHSYYNAERVIDPDNPSITRARLTLMKAIKITIKNVLNLIGVEAPEQM
ncbi:MAG: arginine--tRNA ligase [Firmicutes bacterium]|nr:arginine--tRNA ligase [Bacillota bacterium]